MSTFKRFLFKLIIKLSVPLYEQPKHMAVLDHVFSHVLQFVHDESYWTT